MLGRLYLEPDNLQPAPAVSDSQEPCPLHLLPNTASHLLRQFGSLFLAFPVGQGRGYQEPKGVTHPETPFVGGQLRSDWIIQCVIVVTPPLLCPFQSQSPRPRWVNP